MNISDIIQLIGILTSLTTSIIAIGISVRSLKQNSKMIEESTRPYISVYGASVYVDSPSYYLTVKNFGQSSATITSFTYDFDLLKCIDERINDPKNTSPYKEPFENIENTTMAPGQAFHAIIDFNKAIAQTKSINFHLKYSSGTHEYEDDICLNLIGNLGNYVLFPPSSKDNLLTISETLQNMHIHSL